MKKVLHFSLVLCFATSLCAELKVAKNVKYGPHERNVMDIYWDTDFKKAPIVFTIHGGGFKNGSKAYCNPEMQKLYLGKGCVVVSPNYRLMGKGSDVGIADCEIDCAMAVAWMQANAATYQGDAQRIVATGGSAGGYLSARIAYRKKWNWPESAEHTPEQLNIIGWYGDSPYLPPYAIRSVGKGDPPGFMIYGEREHPGTPATQGHTMQARLKEHEVWNQLVYVPKAGHVPGRQVLINARSRDKKAYQAFDQFLDMVLTGKAGPQSGQLLTVQR